MAVGDLLSVDAATFVSKGAVLALVRCAHYRRSTVRLEER
jgi:hypothetical protein